MKINKLLLAPDSTAEGATAIATPPTNAEPPAVTPDTQGTDDAPPADEQSPNAAALLQGEDASVNFDDFTKIIGKGYTNPNSLPTGSEVSNKANDSSSKVGDANKAGDASTKPADEPPANQPADKLPNGLPKITLNAPNAARDYSDLPPEDVDLFKKMSNSAYAKLKPIYLEHKKTTDVLKAKEAEIAQLKTAAPQGLPKSYLEHEEAFTLTPEYNKAVRTANQLSAEQEFWANQLEEVKAGKAWRGLVRNAQGQVVPSEEQSYNPRAEEHIRGKMLLAQSLLAKTEEQITQVATSHKQKVQQGYQQLKSIEKQFFPFFDNPQGEDKRIIEDAIKGLPEAFQDSPMATLLGKAYATCIRLQAAYDEAIANQGAPAVAKSIQDDARRAGPTAGKLGSAPAASNASKDEDVMGEFAKLGIKL